MYVCVCVCVCVCVHVCETDTHSEWKKVFSCQTWYRTLLMIMKDCFSNSVKNQYLAVSLGLSHSLPPPPPSLYVLLLNRHKAILL